MNHITIELTPSPEFARLTTTLIEHIRLLTAELHMVVEGLDALARRPAPAAIDPETIKVDTTPAKPERRLPDARTSMHGRFRRTPERDALLDAEWPAGVSIKGIATRFNALPGAKLTDSSIAAYATARGLRRPKWFVVKDVPDTLEEALAWKARMEKPVEPAPAKAYANRVSAPAVRRDGHWVPADQALSTSERQIRDEAAVAGDAPMDLDGALEWGRRNGAVMVGDANLDWASVQSRRAALDLPRYRLVVPIGPVRPLPGERVGGHRE
jgi:hypothetical protein